MKIKLLIILITLHFPARYLFAQDDDMDAREKLTFGIKAGANYSNVWDGKGQEFQADPIIGFAGGAFAVIPIGMFLGLQPEFLISQKGFKGSGYLLSKPYSFSRVTTYFDIPLMLEIKPAPFLYLVLGPQYSFLLTEKNEYSFGSNSVAQQQEFDNENVRKNILGFVAGGDINIHHVVISGRAGWDFQQNTGDGSSFTPRYKNRWLQLTLGYKL
ncbi:MAG: PorT family protein [Bacteroidetes bacterium]|nr:PorT family protein [Bacteroidota bacterium]